MLFLAWARAWLVCLTTCWGGGGKSLCAEMLKHGEEPKPAMLSPGAPQEPPAWSPQVGQGSLPLCGAAQHQALLDLARLGTVVQKNSLNTRQTAIGETKPAVFSTRGAEGEGQGVPDPARGSHRALACSPSPGGAERARGPAPSPLLTDFGSSSCFFQC